MDIRKRLFVIIGLIVGIIAALVLVIVLRSGEVNAPVDSNIPQIEFTNSNSNNTNQEDIPSFVPPQKIEKENPAVSEKKYVGQLAGIFVERFGSYSNQNGNLHLEDVKSMGTGRMIKWMNTKKIDQSVEYSGMTTNVFSTSIDAFEERSATVRLGVQQILQTTGQKTDEYLTARVELLKIGPTWMVDGLYWED